MTVQQTLTDETVVPPLDAAEGVSGVVVESGWGDDDAEPTHTTVRIQQRIASRLDALATQAYRDDRVPTAVVKQLRRFANVAQSCEGPVVIVPVAWADTARETADLIHEREEDGLSWRCSELRDAGYQVKKCRGQGFRRADFDVDLTGRVCGRWTRLVVSSNGLWHICTDDRAACGNFDPDNGRGEITEFNAADVLSELRLCRSAEKRIGGLVKRLAESATARMYYSESQRR